MCKIFPLILIAATAAPAGAAEQVNLQYQALPSGTPNVWNLYLTETSPTSLLSGELGLSDAGVKVSRTSGDAVTVGAIANNLMGIGFDDSSTAATFTASTASLSLHTTFPRASGVLPDGGRQVLLGTLTISPGSTDSSFSVTAWGSPNYTVSYANIKNLDVTGSLGTTYQWTAAQGSSFTVSAIPEPSALGFVAAGGLLMLRRRNVA